MKEGYPPLYTSEVEMESEEGRARDYTGCFHFSLAWCLASEVDVKASEQVLEEVWGEKAERAHSMRISVDQVLVKIGNAVHSIELGSRSKTDRSQDLFS